MTRRIAVTVAFAAPGIEALVALDLDAGANVADAVAASGLLVRHALAPDRAAFAIFGQRAAPDTPLADGDRVEITRPLRVDAKAARRARAAAQANRPGGRRRSVPG